MSFGLAASLASNSEMEIRVTCSFFPVFSSYALNISLNDCSRVVVSQTPLAYHRLGATFVSPAMVNARFFNCSGGRCVKT